MVKTLTFNIKNPPKRKIPKMRVGRDHHYTMIFPTDLLDKVGCKYWKLYGMPYISYFDSFLEDCYKELYKWHPDPLNAPIDIACIYTACLN